MDYLHVFYLLSVLLNRIINGTEGAREHSEASFNHKNYFILNSFILKYCNVQLRSYGWDSGAIRPLLPNSVLSFI